MKCNYFYSNTVNEEIVKRNNRGYRKERKEKYIKAKTSPRMNGMIHRLYIILLCIWMLMLCVHILASDVILGGCR